MRTTSLHIPTLILMLCAAALPAQTVQKTLVRAFDKGDAQELTLDLGYPATIQHWDAATVRVQMQIGLDNVHESMLQTLISGGRYNLKGEDQGQAFAISAPGLRKNVRIGEKLLTERVAFSVFVPQGLTVRIVETKTTEGVVEGISALKPMR
ncbi:MAG TPA: hypothetical protein PK198_18160 [Saprospiraceae bacterium]|nr:hypothetical protein [Saprospiraceae bacterium]HRK82048.1 hypothetical protein [Saprospiraceae bacterium]